MSDHPYRDPNPRWLDHQKNRDKVFYGLVAACIASIAVEFFVHRHVDHPFEGLFGFYGLWGFVSIVVLIMLAIGLRKIVKRGEDYYDG